MSPKSGANTAADTSVSGLLGSLLFASLDAGGTAVAGLVDCPLLPAKVKGWWGGDNFGLDPYSFIKLTPAGGELPKLF